MEVILTQDIETLGKAGYARNYLLPRSMAIPATRGSIKQLEHDKRLAEAKNARFVKDAKERAAALEQVPLVFKRRVGEELKLFGSVTSIDVHRELKEQGHDIDRRAIDLPEPIKALGTQEVKVRMAADIYATLKVRVEPEEAAG